LIGRGANLITRSLDHAFHVRLVGSLEKRVEHFQKAQGLTKEAAQRMIRNEDRGRRRYVRSYFGEDVDNPLLYNLVLNTDLLPHAQAAQMIGSATLDRFSAARLSPSIRRL
jgi:cytidylate kinase